MLAEEGSTKALEVQHEKANAMTSSHYSANKSIGDRNATAVLTTLALLCLCAPTASAYEVWIGTHCTSKNAALNTEMWKKTAELVEGLNAHTAPSKPSPGTPNENDVSATDADWKMIFSQFSKRNNAMIETARSGLYSPTKPDKPKFPDFMADKFERASRLGYAVNRIMFYDNKTGDVDYSWTDAEIQEMRDWLDSNGHRDVRLVTNCRNNNCRRMCEHPLVDDIMLEAAPELWHSNVGQRQELLKWLWTTPSVKNKRLIFQIPTHHDPYGNPTAYQKVRRLLVWFGNELMSSEFMRSPRVIFEPVTYNNTTFAFYPEKDPGNPNEYVNTLTGLTLSLIEQRDLFEARSRIPTQEDADSFARDVNTGSDADSGSDTDANSVSDTDNASDSDTDNSRASDESNSIPDNSDMGGNRTTASGCQVIAPGSGPQWSTFMIGFAVVSLVLRLRQKPSRRSKRPTA